MEIEVIKFDNLGRGIGYINNKIIFIPKTIPGDLVEIQITQEKKNYYEGRLVKIIKPSILRKKAICPYFNECGGCDFLNISLSDSLDYKLDMINELLTKNNIDYKVQNIIKNKENYNYRNKITLKIINGAIGFYQNESHQLIEINYCYLAKDEINNILKDLHILNIKNGTLTIRCNYKNELLLDIKTEDKIDNIDDLVSKYKIIGIVLNDKCIYGDDYFIEKLDNFLFKVSYNAFFQVNPYICTEIFNLIKENTKNSEKVLDLYCGVGTLSIVASTNAKKLMGVEIVENAIKDANFNKKLNNQNNLEFICADTKNILNKMTSNYDTIILDPPRSGVPSKVLNKIKDENINKIIYISCNPHTLVRDLDLLKDSYKINDFIILDMFTHTHHLESFCILTKK